MKYLLFAVCMSLTLPAWADHDHGKDMPATDTKAATPPMDPNMKRMMEMGTPGAEHARLKPVVGDWTVASKMWEGPDAKPMESKGSARYSWMLGGRILKLEFKGDMMGQPFQGVGHHGYDKVRGEYFGTWMDSMSTGMALGTGGRYDEATNTISDTGSYADPMTMDKNKWYRSEWTLPTEKNPAMTFSMYNKDEKGAEFKMMEMVYTRPK